MTGVERETGAGAARLHNGDGRAAMLIVCEHASCHIPAEYNHLGLTPALREAHIAWDPGALAVAEHLSEVFEAPLVAGTASRLLFDCNRPPEAPDAIPERSEIHDIPGNRRLSEDDRAERVRRFHDPFRALLAGTLARFAAPPLLVTVHSFTPVYRGEPRAVQIGLLHDSDDRFARAMRDRAAAHTDLAVALNEPYGPEDGVTHTLRTHALPVGAPNVMLEIRNDLIATPQAQGDMGRMLAGWIAAAAARDCGFATGAEGKTCV